MASFACPHGHRWDAPASSTTRLSDPSCPVCGALGSIVIVPAPSDALPADRDATNQTPAEPVDPDGTKYMPTPPADPDGTNDTTDAFFGTRPNSTLAARQRAQIDDRCRKCGSTNA